MPGTRSSTVRKSLLALGLAVLAAVPLCAQPGRPGFSDPFGLRGQDRARGFGADWTATLERTGKADEVLLRISVKLAPEHYVYPTTYDKGALMKFKIEKATGLEPVEKDFVADHEAEPYDDPDLNKIVEKYYDAVAWTRHFRLKPGVDAFSVLIAGEVVYQICDAMNCRPDQKYAFHVKLADSRAAGQDSVEEVPNSVATESEDSHTRFDQLIGKAEDHNVGSTWKVLVSPRHVKPGSVITISVQADLQPGWHVYPLDLPLSEDGDSLPTVIGLTELGGLIPADTTIVGPRVIAKAATDDSGKIDRFHEGRLVWARKFKVPADSGSGNINLSGKIAWQMCTMRKCLLATGFEFSGRLTTKEVANSDLLVLTVGKTLSNAEASEAIEELHRSNFAGGATLVQTEESTTTTVEAASTRKKNDDVRKSPSVVIEGEDPVAQAGAAGGKLNAMPLHVFLGLAVLAGFAALATPCVFPMIPITVSFFQKQAEKEHHRPAAMASVYCLGIIGAFTGLGMLMSILFGATSLPEFANTVFFNLMLAGLLIFFGFNLLGMFEIRMPSWLLTYTAGQESKGGFIGVLFMALTFTLTSFTCTFAFAGGLLVMAESGDRLRPILGLLAFSTAFSLPFFFLALFPSMLKKLPRSGGWMNVAKVLMGLVELGAAVKFLGNADQRWNGQPAIIDFHLTIAIWAVISIGAALYLFGVFRLPHDVPTENIGVLRFVAAMSFLGYSLYLGVGMFGAQKPQGAIWKNVEALANSTFDVGTDPTGPYSKHGDLKYALDFERALNLAIKENKPLFLDFTGVNCANCRKMEGGPMSQPEIEQRLGKFVRIQLFTDTLPLRDRAEAERLTEFNKKLQKRWFGAISLPYYAVIPPDRAVLTDPSKILSQFEGYDPDQSLFARFLDDGWSKWKEIQAQKGRQVVERN
ncbi:MAG: hypothetical protein HY290_02070 [Planctomycetia bacterium]|nr:hypothetical protein [Planctomycetia bacterium]